MSDSINDKSDSQSFSNFPPQNTNQTPAQRPGQIQRNPSHGITRTSSNHNSENFSNQTLARAPGPIQRSNGTPNPGPQRTPSNVPQRAPSNHYSSDQKSVQNKNKPPPPPVDYTIDDKREKLLSPQFIRVPNIIKFDSSFRIKDIIGYFDIYDSKFESDFKFEDEELKGIPKLGDPDNQRFYNMFCLYLKTTEEDADENKPYVDYRYHKLYNFPIEWMTVSNTRVEMYAVWVRCKMQLTAKSNLVAYYCIFEPQDLTKTESAVEVFANSTATFINCHFYNSNRVAVIARNYSTVKFVNCVFDNNKISVFVMDDSVAKFINCRFTNDQNISIFVTKNSKAEMSGSLFKNINGKATFAKDQSEIFVTNTIFNCCAKGASTIAESSKLFLSNVEKLDLQDEIIQTATEDLGKHGAEFVNKSFSDKKIVQIINPNNTALRAINKSQIEANEVFISGTEGNAINMENSSGHFFNCTITDTIHPTIAVIGRKSRPFFYNCKLLNNRKTFCVICKNCCRPLFMKCDFESCDTNCISISDFSMPHIENCRFRNIGKKYLNVFSGASITYYNLRDMDKENEKVKPSLSPTINICQEKTLKEVIHDDEIRKDELKKKLKEAIENGLITEEEDDNDEGYHVKSWKSPTYSDPEKISKMEKLVVSEDDLKNLIDKGFEECSILTEVNILEIVFKYDRKIEDDEADDIDESDDKTKSKEVEFVCSMPDCRKLIKDTPYIFTPCGHPVCNECRTKLLADSDKIKKEYDEKIKNLNIEDVKARKTEEEKLKKEMDNKLKEIVIICPVCDSPVKEFKKILSESECSICLDKVATTVSLPCGHLCMCYRCASKCAEKNFNCPMCNEPLSSYKYVFKDVIEKKEE